MLLGSYALPWYLPKAQIDLPNPRELLVGGDMPIAINLLSLFVFCLFRYIYAYISPSIIDKGHTLGGNISRFLFLKVYESHPRNE